jgi:hypothetical protein
MEHLLSLRILAAGLLLLAPTIQAQELAGPVRDPGALASQAPEPCGTWGLWALRGTYAFTATAWQDLSEINPALPRGYAPVTIIGAFKVNGNGDVTGWASVNAGGVQMGAEFVNSKFSAPKADCSVPISLSMRMKGAFGGAVTGPYPYVGVIAGGDGPALEIAFMMLGTGPGSHVELNHAKRISMNFN